MTIELQEEETKSLLIAFVINGSICHINRKIYMKYCVNIYFSFQKVINLVI
jgi:hypothetical protein